MRAVLVVVANILREPTFQVAFVNCNDVLSWITSLSSIRLGCAEYSRIISITTNVAVHNCRSKKIHLSADQSSLRCSVT